MVWKGINVVKDIYTQIISLYNEENKQSRGYKFEHLIREIQPWSYKPPISAIGNSEQLDGVYEWDGRIYIIEAKAKEKKILQGSSDWEDFELKIRRRNKSVVGLFLSLYDIDENIIRQCEMMNKEGYSVFVLYGGLWKELFDNPIGFELILRYLLLHSRINNKATISGVNEIKKWYFHNEEIITKYNDICVKASSVFLRRYKQDKHEELYVKRGIDNKVDDYIRNLYPKALSKTKKTKKKKGSYEDIMYEVDREVPPQLLIIRDVCGAGKTTYSVENAITDKKYISFTKSASESNLDSVVEEILQSFGKDYGILEMLEINQPVVFVLDSLDEAQTMPNKINEIKSLIKFLDKLNSISKRYGLYAYPMVIIFTVREEYWREWESLFEGLRVKHLFKVFSEFSDEEIKVALEKYQKIYHYNICNELSKDDILTLSNPLNLSIFSETNKFMGNIEIKQVFTANVLHNYFKNKCEEVYKRGLRGLTSRILLDICENFLSMCAYKTLHLQRNDFYEFLSKEYPLFLPYVEELLRLYESILIFRFDDSGSLIVRHMKFFEYLYADFMIQKSINMNKEKVIIFLDDFINKIYTAKFVDLIEIYNNIKFLYTINGYETIVQNYLDESNDFMRNKLCNLRCRISEGQKHRIDNYNQIVSGKSISDGDLLMEAYFVCSAKCNYPDSEELLVLFLRTWKVNEDNVNRWKLLPKLNVYHLLDNNRVMSLIVKSKSWKEWQVYLGYLLQEYDTLKFIEFMQESDECRVLDYLKLGGEWIYVKELIQKCGNK